MRETLDQKKLNRILDANFNRAKEGLRVCEDVCRFVWDESSQTRQWKILRHKLTDVVGGLGLIEILKDRNIEGDVGRDSSPSEMVRRNVGDIFYANCQRVKESLRVLEEFAKLKRPKLAQQLKAMRYKLYALEKSITKKS